MMNQLWAEVLASLACSEPAHQQQLLAQAAVQYFTKHLLPHIGPSIVYLAAYLHTNFLMQHMQLRGAQEDHLLPGHWVNERLYNLP